MSDASAATLAIVLGMAAVTYLLRVVPLLGAGAGRVPPWALMYLRLVAPAMLASLAAVGVLLMTRTASAGGAERSLHLGIEVVAVVACVLIVAAGRSLFVGLAVAVLVAIVGRQLGP